MSGTISTLKKKLLGSSSRKSKEDLPESSDTAMNIGTPTDVKRLHHVTVDENGIRGLPPELQRMLEHMTTAEERQNPDNKAKAKNVLMWMKKEEEKKGDNFIRGDFMNFGSSGESTASNESGGRSSSDPAKSTFYIESSVQKEIDLDSSSSSATTLKLDNQKSEGQGDDNANRTLTADLATTDKVATPKEESSTKGDEGEATLRYVYIRSNSILRKSLDLILTFIDGKVGVATKVPELRATSRRRKSCPKCRTYVVRATLWTSMTEILSSVPVPQELSSSPYTRRATTA